MTDEAYVPQVSSAPSGRWHLTSEHQDTFRLLEQVLGKSIADRYIDFCTLSYGIHGLRVSVPIAAHALRELDSIFRGALEELAGVNPGPSDTELEQQNAASDALRKLGYDDDAINRAVGGLIPRASHKSAIKKIVAWLGLAENGDIAKAWLAVSGAHKKAHERKFNRALHVDDEFRRVWADPFEMVIRGVAVTLQSKFAAFIVRTEALARMTDIPSALAAFEKQNIGALTVQRHFYWSIRGPEWLPELIKRGLVVEPLPAPPDDEVDQTFREWPVGIYLLRLADDGNGPVFHSLAAVIRSLADSNNPNVRRTCMTILASMPGEISAQLTDVAIGWLSRDADFGLTSPAEKLISKLAAAGLHEACDSLASALFQLFDQNGDIATSFSQHMYEHSLVIAEPTLTAALGFGALRLLTQLLYEAAVISRKIRFEPPQDYTSASAPLPKNSQSVYDVFGALTFATIECATRLVREEHADVRGIMDILLKNKFQLAQRIALHVLAQKSEAAPEKADELLFDSELLEAHSARHEYAALAIARYPALTMERRHDLLRLVDQIPVKNLKSYKKRLSDYEKRDTTPEDELRFSQAVVRDAIWYWRSVLPEDRQHELDQTVAALGEPDAWHRGFDHPPQSPTGAPDLKVALVQEIAAYLQTWAPGEERTHETRSALGNELRNAVQAEPMKFSSGATLFAGLSPLYVRRLFEGLRFAAEQKVAIDWPQLFQLIEAILPKSSAPNPGEASMDGEDPSWFWAAKEAAALLCAGLRQGADGVPPRCDNIIREIIEAVEGIAPSEPEFDDFESRFQGNAFFAASETMLGLATELNILRILWLSKQSGSPTFNEPRVGLSHIPGFMEFASRVLACKGSNGRVVHAIFGRHLNLLLYFGEDWVKSNFHLIFPVEGSLAECAWEAHLLYDSGPPKTLGAEMAPLYRREIARLNDVQPSRTGDHRQERLGDYLLILYILNSLGTGLIDEFWAVAPQRLRKHVIWFLGNELGRGTDMPSDLRARGEAYWEARLAAAEAATDREQFREELGTIGSWTVHMGIAPAWLIAQMQRTLLGGYCPGNSFSVLQWAARISPEYCDDVVALIEAFFRNPHIEAWVFLSQQSEIRTILIAGLASPNAATHERVKAIISILAARGETGFVDLLGRVPGNGR